jgi:putative ABC transport system substrate-binding protein
MKRREFITLLSGATAAWPLAAPAEQPDRLRRIGVLMGSAEGDPQAKTNLAIFTRTLRQQGWEEGRDIRIEYRWAEGDAEQMRAFARELVALQPDLIVGHAPKLPPRCSGKPV